MKVSNRYVRLMPRAIVVIVAMCLPLVRGMTAIAYLGVLVCLMVATLLWEWCASLERGGGLIEP